MSEELIRVLDALILPPGGPLLIILLGLLLWRRRKLSALVILAGLSAQYLSSTPYLASRLMAGVEPYPALSDAELHTTTARAIVVLCGGRYEDAPEFGGDTASPRLLARLRYAAWIQRRTGLPIIVSGGTQGRHGPAEAVLARRVLEDELGARVSLIEDKSQTTWENARFTAPILRRQGIGRVLLVTHAWHLRRAMYAFRHNGVQAIPAPTHFGHTAVAGGRLSDWLPSASALTNSYYALHEYLGLFWYKLRHPPGR